MFKSFLKTTAGNTALLAGLLLAPAFGFVGAGYDVVRATSYSAKLQTVIEGAALASASLTNSQDIETVIAEYIDANLGSAVSQLDPLDIDVTPVIAVNSRTVEIDAAAEVTTFFLKIVGIGTLPVTARTVANQSATNVELSLVLDISSSMDGAKITELKDSGERFVDQILNPSNIARTTINLVPFGGSVNIADLYDDYDPPTSIISKGDPTAAAYDINAGVLDAGFWFSAGNECIEYIDDDFDAGPLGAANRSQIPNFWKWNDFNPWCPPDASAVFLNTNQKETIKTRIRNLELSDGTGLDIGAMWGLKTLSPDWRGELGGDFPTRPSDFGEADTMKVLVVMTDGEITHQFRPADYTPENTDGSSNQQTVVQKGNASSLPTDDDAVGHFKRICDEAKLEGVVVYTIGFQIALGAVSDQILEYCASDPSKYYFVETLDIQSAFDSIAASVNALRITG